VFLDTLEARQVVTVTASESAGTGRPGVELGLGLCVAGAPDFRVEGSSEGLLSFLQTRKCGRVEIFAKCEKMLNLKGATGVVVVVKEEEQEDFSYAMIL
jgi:hypothetical protein